MSEPRSYPHGVTSWIDHEAPDPAAAVAFYGELFGWQSAEAMPEGVPGTYLIASLDGQDVGGITTADAGPARWNTYVAVADMDVTAAAFTAAGGELEVFPARPPGRSAFGVDPTGAPVRLWQAGRRLGTQLVNAPGGWNFSNLHTPDPGAAIDFYRELFGWSVGEPDPGTGAQMVQVPGYGDHLAATCDPDIFQRQAAAPPGFADVIGSVVPDPDGPPRWQVTFTVADRDASAAEAERLGASVVSVTADGWSRQAVVRDPQGAELVLSQFTPPEGW